MGPSHALLDQNGARSAIYVHVLSDRRKGVAFIQVAAALRMQSLWNKTTDLSDMCAVRGEGEATVDGKAFRPSHKVKAGDEVSVRLKESGPPKLIEAVEEVLNKLRITEKKKKFQQRM